MTDEKRCEKKWCRIILRANGTCPACTPRFSNLQDLVTEMRNGNVANDVRAVLDNDSVAFFLDEEAMYNYDGDPRVVLSEALSILDIDSEWP